MHAIMKWFYICCRGECTDMRFENASILQMHPEFARICDEAALRLVNYNF